MGNAAYDRTERAYLNIGTDNDAEDEEFTIESTTTSTNTGTDPTPVTPTDDDFEVKIDDAQDAEVHAGPDQLRDGQHHR